MSGLSQFSLDGKRALVTGASRGIGRAAAMALASAGADVVCAASTVASAQDTANAVRSLGRESWAMGADLSVREEVLALADAAESATGAIDILICNAGTIRRTPAVDYSMDDWDIVMRTNLDATFQLAQRLGRGMVERRRGNIVLVASLLSFSGGITVPAYTASKHAVAGLTKALANEWASAGVNVNAIAPGYFETDNTQRLRDDANRLRDITARIPAARWGKPEDLAGAFVFLSSAASSYVNGHVLTVDGGWMAR